MHSSISESMIGKRNKYCKKNMLQSHFAYCRSHMDSPGIQPMPLLSESEEESAEQLYTFSDTVVFLSVVQFRFILK
jgi:hypothetical protein